MDVRRRVFRQLIGSLVYEDALRYTENPGWFTVDGAGVRYTFTATRRYGFDRVTLTGDPVLREHDGRVAEAESVTRFLAEVRPALTADDECLARFAHELEETLLKDTAAQAARTGVLAGAEYDVLEGAITDGHRYHPAYKSRIGFDLDDNRAHGPEFAQPIRPLWLAAHRSITDVATADGLDEGAFLAAQFGRPDDEFTLLPVHPWQWREQVQHAFADQLRTSQLRVVGEDPHAFTAQQSIRTLSCRDDPLRPYLKLALSIVNTSTSRVLAPHTVRNAPAVSDWLRRVVASDEFLRDELRLILLGEVMGTAVVPEPPAEFARHRTYGTLACIWRDSLHRHLDPGERAVPFTGLTACDLDGTPLIDSWVRALGLREWLGLLVEVAVIPLLHLLFRHGIALESHAQNMVLVHRGGIPARVALKDFHDGVRFSRDHLAEPRLCPSLADPPAHHVNANSFLETDDLGQVVDFLLDAFCFVNLGELAIFLTDHYDLDEREFWAIVRDGVRAYQKRFAELEDRFALFDVFKPRLAVEKLTTRRLLPDTEVRTHEVRNPLVESGC